MKIGSTASRNIPFHELVASCIVVLGAFILLYPFWTSGAAHSFSQDQYFLMPPGLNGAYNAWISGGSFYLNELTTEPLWGNPHFSAYYFPYAWIQFFFPASEPPLQQNIMVIFHRLVFAVGVFALCREIEIDRTLSTILAIICAVSEPTRIVGNFVWALSSYSWLPFVLWGLVGIYLGKRYALLVLVLASTMMIHASPVYIGLGLVIIPGIVFFVASVAKFQCKLNPKFQLDVSRLLQFVFAGIIVILLTSSVLLAIYAELSDTIRWTRDGPLIGRQAGAVGSEIFAEAQSLDYFKRLFVTHGARGIYSSYYVTPLIACLFFIAPIVWWLKDAPSRVKNSKLFLWSIALFSLALVFGDQLVFTRIVEIIPVVSSFRHISAHGGIFLLLATILAGDALLSLVRFDEKLDDNKERQRRIHLFVLVLLILSLIGIAIWRVSDREFLPIALTAIAIVTAVRVKKVAPLAVFATLLSVLFLHFTSPFNQPSLSSSNRYQVVLDELKVLVADVDPKGEYLSIQEFLQVSPDYPANSLKLESYLSVQGFRVVRSYFSPRHHQRFIYSNRLRSRTIDGMSDGGITLVLSRKEDQIPGVPVLNETGRFTLQRIRKNRAINLQNCQSGKACFEAMKDSQGLVVYTYPFEEYKVFHNGKQYRGKIDVKVDRIEFPGAQTSGIWELKYIPHNLALYIIATFLGLAIFAIVLFWSWRQTQAIRQN